MRRSTSVDRHPGEQMLLPYGFTVVVRPISATDGPLLVDGFARLSASSRQFRFLGGKSVLTTADVRYLTDVDHHDHEAVVALDLAGRGVGVARFVRDNQRRHAAEVAIVVVDEWQRRGVGTALLARLAERADQEGITCFTGTMADDNRAVSALMRAAGAPVAVTGMEAGAIRFTVPVGGLLVDPSRADQFLPSPCFA